MTKTEFLLWLWGPTFFFGLTRDPIRVEIPLKNARERAARKGGEFSRGIGLPTTSPPVRRAHLTCSPGSLLRPLSLFAEDKVPRNRARARITSTRGKTFAAGERAEAEITPVALARSSRSSLRES